MEELTSKAPKAAPLSEIPRTLSGTYSADGGQGDYEISGSIRLGIWHRENTLFVQVVEARHLACIRHGAKSDPYIKAYLLPDCSKITKRKTSIKLRTNHPKYNETFEFKVARRGINEKCLWLSVWDWDILGRNQFLGEICLQLSNLDLNYPQYEWHSLMDRFVLPENEDRGTITVLFKYMEDRRSFLIVVEKANNLLPIASNEDTSIFVTSFLYPIQPPFARPKTKCIKKTLNPIWNEQLEYKSINLEDLKESKLEISVWNHDEEGCHDFLGSVSFGLDQVGRKTDVDNKAAFTSTKHWSQMLCCEKKWIKACENLQPITGYRFTLHPSIQEEYFKASAGDYNSSQLLVKKQGMLLLKLEHHEDCIVLYIIQAESLPPVHPSGSCDPFIKLYLLYNKTVIKKWKTSVKMNTTNPIFNELFKLYANESLMESHHLLLTVWDWERSGDHNFLGQTEVYLNRFTVSGNHQYFSLVNPNWYTSPELYYESSELSSQKSRSTTGQLTISLLFDVHKMMDQMEMGTLYVCIRNAAEIPVDENTEDPKAYCKAALLPVKVPRNDVNTTKLVKNDGYPLWNEILVFKDIILQDLYLNHAIEVTVLEYSKSDAVKFLGCVHLGPSMSFDHTEQCLYLNKGEVTHWKEMLMSPGKWIEKCHFLKPSNDTRRDSISSVSYNGKSMFEILPDKPNSTPDNLTQRAEDVQNTHHYQVPVPVFPPTIRICDPFPVTNENIEDDKVVVKPLPPKEEGPPVPPRPSKKVVQLPPLPPRGVKQIPPLPSKREVPVLSLPPKREALAPPLPPKGVVPVPSLSPKGVGKDSSFSNFEDAQNTLQNDEAQVPPLPPRTSLTREDNFVTQPTHYFEPRKIHGHTRRKHTNEDINDDSSGHMEQEDFVTQPTQHYFKPRKTHKHTRRKHIYEEIDGDQNESVEQEGFITQTTHYYKPRKTYKHTQRQHVYEGIDEDSSETGKQAFSYPRKPHIYAEMEVLPSEHIEKELNNGKMIVSLMFEVTSYTQNHAIGNLYLKIKSALHLQCPINEGVFAEIALFPKDQPNEIKQTKVIKNTTNPTWEEEFKFTNLFFKELMSIRVLDISVWTIEVGEKAFVGRLCLGPDVTNTTAQIPYMHGSVEETQHWMSVLENPGTWVEDIHYLQS